MFKVNNLVVKKLIIFVVSSLELKVEMICVKLCNMCFDVRTCSLIKTKIGAFRKVTKKQLFMIDIVMT